MRCNFATLFYWIASGYAFAMTEIPLLSAMASVVIASCVEARRRLASYPCTGRRHSTVSAACRKRWRV
ncbi:MAG: hypothetical protein LBF85_03660 [Tannerella sp.]|nr:hypothetical protein [Tannerella sp.]